ncbi:MAG: hypothetical protein ACHP7J_04810 [Terriglobales bacterium]
MSHAGAFEKKPRFDVRNYYISGAVLSVTRPADGSVLFTDRAVKVHVSFERFLKNQIRHAFGFMGTPIWIKNRARE